MVITQCKGYELEKEKSNTSEDFFNRSEVTIIENGQEKTVHILYIRYFDERFQEFTPYEKDPIFTAVSRDIAFKDIVALVCLLENPGYRHRKRVYINSEREFAAMFKKVNLSKLPEIFTALEESGKYEISSPLDYIEQPV
ncbi:hypothetical protein [Mesobacillus zeae]|uniref:Uncharacterized protein n=1 Tax=Mesobacillus zeae TaxID=1917180 RepID=A0A398BCP1_9BACI|nr:hypothetical protein [Mesobacillus zeae]RID87344.1 hypothetical protein D1970_05305 [Mesobacillus zeae]